MTVRENKLVRDLLTLSRRSLLTNPAVSVSLQLLATAVEVGTTDEFAEAAMSQAEANLHALNAEIGAMLAEIGHPALCPSAN